MSYDGSVMRALVHELNTKFVGGRIDKIYQPEDEEIYLHLRNGPLREMLLISANSSDARSHLTKQKKQNPMQAPNFCMVLRKHLENARIIGFKQIAMDRIYHIKCESMNELGDLVIKTLIVEIMGKHSNIILIDENDIIIDSIKRINANISRVRQVLPGLKYTIDNISTKKNPLIETKKGLYESFEKTPGSKNLRNFFVSNYTGISPLMGREICARSDIDESRPINSVQGDFNKIYQGFESIMSLLRNHQYTPTAIIHDEQTIAFSCIPLVQYGTTDAVTFNSISELLDHYYTLRAKVHRRNQKSQNLERQLETHLERALKKKSKQEQELLEAKERKKFKIYADVLSANAYGIERGETEVTLENFYDNMNLINIPLDKRKNAVQNAAFYYKKYSKLKHANKVLKTELLKTNHQIEYLEDLIYSLSEARTPNEVDDIKDQFSEDYLKKRQRKKKKKKRKPSKPMEFHTEDNCIFYVGKNNRQNEELTLKFAHRKDYWFHVKDAPGSHVILKTNGKPVTKKLLETGAMLAAYFSKSRLSSNVEVDYTQKKFVKRHPSGQTGLVTYTNFKTIIVTPTDKIFEKIKEK